MNTIGSVETIPASESSSEASFESEVKRLGGKWGKTSMNVEEMALRGEIIRLRRLAEDRANQILQLTETNRELRAKLDKAEAELAYGDGEAYRDGEE